MRTRKRVAGQRKVKQESHILMYFSNISQPDHPGVVDEVVEARKLFVDLLCKSLYVLLRREVQFGRVHIGVTGRGGDGVSRFSALET
jgi:hypothetical protein